MRGRDKLIDEGHMIRDACRRQRWRLGAPETDELGICTMRRFPNVLLRQRGVSMDPRGCPWSAPEALEGTRRFPVVH